MVNGTSIVDIANNATAATASEAFGVIFPHVQVAVHQFNAVRYVAVACLIVALLDRVLACPGRTCKLYRSPLSTIKLLYFANRYINLCCLGIDVFLYTQWLFTDRETCLWWFSFRAWTGVIVVAVIEALLIWRLYLILERKKFIAGAFGLVVLAQMLTNCFLTKRGTLRVSAVPSPGVWFSGCFPVFDSVVLWFNWITGMVIKVVICFAAIVSTLSTWSTSREQKSLWRCSEENGIRFYLAIAASSIFVTVWWLAAPLPLKEISPTAASALYAVFGSGLVLSMFEYRCSLPPDPPVELRVIPPTKAEIVSQHSGHDVSPPIDLEKGLHAATLDLSPHSRASTLLNPDGKRDGAPGLQMIPGSVDTLIQDHAHSSEFPSPCSQTSLHGTAVSTVEHPSIYDVDAEPIASSSRRPFSEDMPRLPRDGDTSVDEEQDELDRELAEEYDEDGGKRKPRRMHTRRWKSEEVAPRFLYTESSVTAAMRTQSPLGPLGPVAGPSNPRPSRMCGQNPFGRSRQNHARPSSPPAASTHRSSCERSSGSRHRLSRLLHLHRSESQTSCVPEEDTADASRLQESEGSRDNRLSRAPSHQAGRFRRMLASSPPASPSSVRTALQRRESDALTICSISTAFQFDNTHVLDAPDFTN